MYRKRLLRVVGLFVVFSMVLGVFAPAFASLPLDSSSTPKHIVTRPHNQGGPLYVVYPDRHDLSAPLISMKGRPLTPKEKEERAKIHEIRLHPLPKALKAANQSGHGSDPNLVQSSMNPSGPAMPAPAASFDGIYNTYHVLPPDTNGDIGYDPDTGKKYYFQIVNLGYAVWDVTDPSIPTQVITPTLNNEMWNGFGGICESNNDGDPIVLFDHLANRWLFSQFALDFDNNKFYQCIAVSASADPTGSWYRYSYQIPSDLMNDYPKFGVWPDAYYMTANQFDLNNNGAWAGAGVFAFERSAMLTGDNARMIYINVGDKNLNYGGMLPADLDGAAPPEGTPGYFVEWDDSSWLNDPQDTLRIWEFHINWDDPSSSTFGANSSYDPNYMVATGDVDPNMCGYSRNCIPQPGGTPLDAISDRLMYRLAFRVWDDGTFSMVSNHTVDVDGSDHAGIHWFELKWDGSTWSMAQEGVYAPDDNHRWMGSIAMDSSRDMALGYSVSSTSVYPSVYFTGRLAGDPLGHMGMGPEGVFVSGGGSQGSSYGRWGDYSMMGVDPQDGCTFWYTQEYYPADSSATWYTRIGAFKFPTCTAGPRGALEGNVTDSSSGNGIVEATVEISDLGVSTVTDSSGHYSFASVPVGTYTVTVSAFGYAQGSASVTINQDETSTQDFALNPLPRHNITFTVKDNNTHWPLYARIEVNGDPEGPFFTDPLTGQAVVSVPDGTYVVNVHAMTGGYIDGNDTQTISGDVDWDFYLDPDLDSCSAPGYGFVSGFSEDFENWPLTGWTIVDNVSDGGLVWESNTAYGDGNYTGGAGMAADVNSDANGGVPYDTEMVSPVIDVSSLPGLTLRYKANYQEYSGDEALDLDISTDGGATWSTLLHWTEDHGALYGLPGEDVSLDLANAVGTATSFQLRWHYYTSESSPWDWYAQIDEVGIGTCQPVADGLVYGSVFDANTNALVYPFVIAGSAGPVVSVNASADQSTPDTLYFTGVMAGEQTLTASTTIPGYGTDSEDVTGIAGQVVKQDFYLLAPELSSDPNSLDFGSVLQYTQKKTMSLQLSDIGGLDTTFLIVPINTDGAVTSLQPMHDRVFNLMGNKEMRRRDARGWRGTLPKGAPSIASAGEVETGWDSGLPFAWGIGYDRSDSGAPVWVGNVPLAGNGGDDADYRFQTDGTATGDAIDISSFGGGYAADMAYDPYNHTLWQVGVVGDTCIHELDPATLTVTGNKICPNFGTSERGLAFDPVNDVFIAGSWNDGAIKVFDRHGNILQVVNVGLPISGLAYNPSTGHLFVLINKDTSPDSVYDVYILDAHNGYSVIGGFDVVDADGNPVFGSGNAYGQAGMGIDCDGNLWIVDQGHSKVYEVDSGESGVCDWRADWLQVSTPSGTITPGSSVDIDVTAFPYNHLSPGEHTAMLRVVNDSPYGDFVIPVSITVQGFTPLSGDFSGDGKTDVAVFRSSNNTWYIRGVGHFAYGTEGDIPVPADYNGDGKTDIAVFRPSTNSWHVRGIGAFTFGTQGDIPVPADFNGDGKAEVAVFRPSTNSWHIRGLGHFTFGTVGDIPVVADFNGDGKADIAVFRPSANSWHIRGIGRVFFGAPGDQPVPGDYNGDGRADIAVFRPSDYTWHIRGIGAIAFGAPGDIPVPGDYNGDGKTDIAVFRPSDGTWHIRGIGTITFGAGDDIPAMPQVLH